MNLVLLTALGVGGATVIGSCVGFAFKHLSHKFSDIVLSFAAGVMLAAAVLGLILPSLEYGGTYGLLMTVPGIFAGALCLNFIDKLVPHLHKLVGPDIESHNNHNLSKVLLFVTAIAIHNLPEGIAAGVGFGSGDTTQALLIAGGIALQNVPEGMVIIGPMLAAGPATTLAGVWARRPEAAAELGALPRQGHANQREKGEVIGQGHAGALPRAFAHGTAETAVDGAVIFLLPHLQLGRVDTHVTVHDRLLLIPFFFYYTAFHEGAQPIICKYLRTDCEVLRQENQKFTICSCGGHI